ncbi:sensor histidine kinase [Candidatus Pyrohabitans sp.]
MNLRDASIGTKLILAITVVIIGISSASSIIIYTYQKRSLDDQILERSRTISELLIQIEDHKLISRVAAEFTEVTGYRLRQTSLRPINPANAPDEFEKRVMEMFQQTNMTEYYGVVAGKDGARYFRYMRALQTKEGCTSCHPVYNVGELRGSVSVVAPYEDIAAATKRNLFYILATTQLLTLSIIGVLYYLSRRIVSAPLKELIKEVEGSAKEIQRGEEVKDIPVKSHDEIGMLATSFNNLRKSLSESFKRKNDAIESFVYSISHDLKAPLRSIEGFSTALQEDYGDKLEGEAKHYLDRVIASARKMGVLIDELLEYSRIGRINLARGEVNIAEVVALAIEDNIYEINKKNAKIKIPENLPVIRGAEKQRIYQVFTNLISNALKYNDKEVPEIEVGYRDEGDHYLFYVKDNGIGFDTRYHDKIFEIFQRLHREDEYEGTGVGLAMVKKIIETHGGRIWAEAKPGEGATFYFTLPKEANR